MKTKQSFYKWLMTQKKENDAIGDLARDAQIDKLFPRGAKTYAEIKGHLLNMGACMNAVSTAKVAWNLYSLEFAKYRKANRIRNNLKVFGRIGT